MMATATAVRKPEIKTELPGPRGREIIQADAEYVNPSYPRPDFKLVAESAAGVWVTDVDGNVFLDCNAGVAVCSTGHCHPEVVSAIQDQAARMIHMCGTDYYYSLMPDLAQKLDKIVPIEGRTRTHFANSGTEAVETALKLAMHATGREKFISFFGSFHGRTLGSLSLTSSKAAQRLGFKRQVLDVVHMPYPNEYRNPFSADDCGDGGVVQGAVNWLENRLFKTTTPPEEVAAIVVEPIQGEGGYVPAPEGRLRAVLGGWGVGILPEGLARAPLVRGKLLNVAPGYAMRVPLYWQCWNAESSVLDALGDALAEAVEASRGAVPARHATHRDDAHVAATVD